AFRTAVEDVGSRVIRAKDAPYRMIEAAYGRTRIHAGVDTARSNDGDRTRVVSKSQNAIAIVTGDDGAGARHRNRGRDAALIQAKRYDRSRRRGIPIHRGGGHSGKAGNVVMAGKHTLRRPWQRKGLNRAAPVLQAASLSLSITVMELLSGLKTSGNSPLGESTISPGPDVRLTVERESVSVREVPAEAFTILGTGLYEPATPEG